MVTFIEAGLMAQNLDLVAESMGFSTCQAAGQNTGNRWNKKWKKRHL